MKQKDDELWMKKLKERLDDYAEPTPDFGWEKLEKDLLAGASFHTATQQPERRIFPYRKWTAVAAVASLLLMSSVGAWLLRTSVDTASLSVESMQLAANPQKPALVNSSPLLEQKQPANHKQAYHRVEITVPKEPSLEKASEDIQTEAVDSVDSIEQTGASDTATHSCQPRKQQRDTQRTSSLLAANDAYASLPGARKASSSSWSFGVSVSSSGGASESVSSMMPSYRKVSMLSTSNGILSAPNENHPAIGQIPYAYRISDYLDVKHHQPISFGLSIRKNLKNGFSIETGLTYTLLASDVKLEEMGQDVKQRLHYLGIPLRANWNFWENKRWVTYVSAGGMVEKCVYGELGGEKETVKPLQFSVSSAVGAQFNASQHVGIYFEPGVSYFFEDGSDVSTIRKESPFNFNLQAGIRFTY